MTQSIDTGEDPYEWAARKIEELAPEKNGCGLAVYHTEWGAFCRTEEAEAIIKELKAENHRLNRALWLKRADDARHLVIAYENYDYLDCQQMTIKQETTRTWMTCKLRTAEEWVKVWKNVERKCRAKAEKYR